MENMFWYSSFLAENVKPKKKKIPASSSDFSLIESMVDWIFSCELMFCYYEQIGKKEEKGCKQEWRNK
jgi:hypothetical protein